MDLLVQLWRKRRDSPRVNQLPPVASFGCHSEVPLPECFDAVVCNPLRFFRVCEKLQNLRLEIREVSFNFDVVLLRAAGNKKVVVVLDPLQLVNYDDRATGLSVF
jgi:hypothetical protein